MVLIQIRSIAAIAVLVAAVRLAVRLWSALPWMSTFVEEVIDLQHQL
jgi:hypothetical protein